MRPERKDSKVLADTRLKIAVFIDFDNIEIGVKSTLSVQFDVGVVLEALKERGEVVSKIAYGDWTRAGDYSRSLTQHATKLVQRNLTPGGDKNGADINLALDALEMAFTHNHINAYVIVGGDSDFITLVEKLKQYDKQVFVVGGRAFTSLVMQRNCHEFIAYENLVSGSRRSQDRGRQAGHGSTAQASLDQAVPLVRRALKVLSDREVSPQLGLLKSTLLQLDSTFSERTYGAGSFRDFAQKLATAGYVTLKESGRNVLVELAEGAAARSEDGQAAHQGPREPREHHERETHAPVSGPAPAPQAEPRVAEAVREVRRLFQTAQNPPRWPMYIRQAKQFLRNVDPAFDEHKFDFTNLVDLMRACQREGLFRIERDRQGVMRIFPGNVMQPVDEPAMDEPEEVTPEQQQEDQQVEAVEAEPAGQFAGSEWSRDADAEAQAEAEVVEVDVLQETVSDPIKEGETEAESEQQPVEARPAAPRRRPRATSRTQGGGRARKTAEPAAGSRTRKTPSRPRTARPRTRKDSSSE
jgi:uncharacterized LabA/DUF88 family protein